MVLTPLAVMLLAQLGLLMLLVMFFQRMQKRRLLKELAEFKLAQRPSLDGLDGLDDADFDRAQVELLLNRVLNTSQSIIADAPAATAWCKEQQKIVYSLGEELGLRLETTVEPSLRADSELVTQIDLDAALGREEALEEFDLLDLESLESDTELVDEDLEGLEDEFNLLEENELPEDTLQAAIDKMGDFDLSSLEKELNKS